MGVTDSPCVTGQSIVATVTYEGEQLTPVELRVVEEPKVDEIDYPPEPPSTIEWSGPEGWRGCF